MRFPYPYHLGICVTTLILGIVVRIIPSSLLIIRCSESMPILVLQIKNLVSENESIAEDEVILEFYEDSSDSAMQSNSA